MRQIEFNNLWEGYGVVTYIDVLERNARLNSNAELGLEIKDTGFTKFITEPVLRALVVIKVERNEHQTLFVSKNEYGFTETYLLNNQVEDITIYEIDVANSILKNLIQCSRDTITDNTHT